MERKEERFDKAIKKIISRMEKIEQELNSRELLNSEAIIPGEVKPFGTSGYIPFSKKFIGARSSGNLKTQK